ncbi:hypothetical protein ANN_03164 [Periplaneta americana]|uniref:Reverse transcriptase domain-containing protein n=1 Tax=Periplaneta americana TaxID=6978 RepID=A0ABQ8TY94_PERAM|nr:hypothetical protein ANN_03164 [Periplaneta americana]
MSSTEPVEEDWRITVLRQCNTEFQKQHLIPTVFHGGASIMVWDCMASAGVGTLEFIDRTIDKIKYLNILKKNLLASTQQLGLGSFYMFQQDNEPKHTAHVVRSWLLYKTPKCLQTPPQSPDLNPIYNLWWEHYSKTKLKKILLEEWNKISSETTTKLVPSMPDRLKDVIRAKALATKKNDAETDQKEGKELVGSLAKKKLPTEGYSGRNDEREKRSDKRRFQMIGIIKSDEESQLIKYKTFLQDLSTEFTGRFGEIATMDKEWTLFCNPFGFQQIKAPENLEVELKIYRTARRSEFRRNQESNCSVLQWIKEFLTCRTQRVRVGEELSNPIEITSGVPQGSVLGPLLFLAFVNDLPVNILSRVRLFADDCMVYREIKNHEDTTLLQNDLNRINDWAIANKMKINSLKSKATSFTRKRNKIVASYTLGGETIPEVNKCKYLGITFSSDLGWGEHVTDTAGKAWRALHLVMRVLRKGSDKSKEIAYKSLVRPVMEYGAACWDPYRLEHIKTLEKIKKRALKCCRKNSPLKWDTLTDRRTRIRLCALFKTYRELGHGQQSTPALERSMNEALIASVCNVPFILDTFHQNRGKVPLSTDEPETRSRSPKPLEPRSPLEIRTSHRHQPAYFTVRLTDDEMRRN